MQRTNQINSRSRDRREAVLVSQRGDRGPEMFVNQTTSRPGSSRPASSRPGSSRPGSGRMSGIRGQLYSRQKLRPLGDSPLSSASDPHLPTFLDPPSDDPPNRLRTAVLAKGRRTLHLGPSGSDTCLVPSISDDDIMATPTLSNAEPDLSSTHYDSGVPFQSSYERQSMNECLESISKFDHLHLGQISSNIQGE